MTALISATVFAMLLMGGIAAPLPGTSLAPRTDGAAVLNEPCYVHDAACDGYPVCCVTAGTCISQHSGTVSSTLAYYEGGCQSFESSKKEWKEGSGCKQQGECLVQHLDVCKGGKAKAGYSVEVPEATLARFMGESCGEACPNSNYGHRSRGGDDGPTTTTTTVMSQVTARVMLTVEGEHAKKADALKNGVAAAAAAAGGIPSAQTSGAAMVTVNMPAKTTGSFTANIVIQVSSSDKWTVSDVEKNMQSAKTSDMNEVLARAMGTCTPMKITITGVEVDVTPTPAPAPAPTPKPTPKPADDATTTAAPAASSGGANPAPATGNDVSAAFAPAKMTALMPAAFGIVAAALSM